MTVKHITALGHGLLPSEICRRLMGNNRRDRSNNTPSEVVPDYRHVPDDMDGPASSPFYGTGSSPRTTLLIKREYRRLFFHAAPQRGTPLNNKTCKIRGWRLGLRPQRHLSYRLHRCRLSHQHPDPWRLGRRHVLCPGRAGAMAGAWRWLKDIPQEGLNSD